MKKTALDYDPALDLACLDKIWRQEQEARERRERQMMSSAEMIRFNRNRGMSRRKLEQIYGAEAVTLAIGHPIPEKEHPCPSPVLPVSSAVLPRPATPSRSATPTNSSCSSTNSNFNRLKL